MRLPRRPTLPARSVRALALTAAATTLLSAWACQPKAETPETADLILRGGRVVTVDPRIPEAEAVAIRGDRIVSVGSEADIEAFRGDETEVIELDGRLAIPGFIEGHGHLLGLGTARLQLDLMPTTSYQDLIDLVEEAVAAAEPGDWIVGRGWHQSKWDPVPDPAVRGFQTHDALSAVSPENPVLLRHASGHASFANALAMELAGVTAETVDPPGGEIIQDASGQPTGIFVETAANLVASAYTASRESMTTEELEEEAMRSLLLAQEEAFSKGVTSFQDAGVDVETVELYRQAIDEGKLKLRVWAMLSARLPDLAELLPTLRVVDYGGHRLTVRAIKAYADGALGSRGAWLLDPYEDDPGTTGHNTVPLEDIAAVVRLALQHEYQVGTHAIGDRANQAVLDLYAAAFAELPDGPEDLRFRVEHSQILHPFDVPRFADLGVVAAMQGIHAISDGPWTPDRLGEQRTLERAYQFRDLIDAGVTVMNGTDVPVEDIDPIPSYFGTVVGRMNNGEVLNPDQLMTRMEGLEAYTINAAYGAHEEFSKGSLTPGKLADVVVLSQDILEVPDDQILSTRVDVTIVGGEVVYRREGS
ncbi:MAG: amidohydrolase [marine benthic group bacterium]|nr:amidohydrolase [Candidatus Benthicola marisminoris]